MVWISNSRICVLSDGKIQGLLNFEDKDKNYTFAGIELANTIYGLEEPNNQEISQQQSKITLINSATKKQYDYEVSGIAKHIASAEDIIAINLGTEIYFINSKGWLVKKYIANQEVREIKISGRIAAIIFKDKIEVLIL